MTADQAPVRPKPSSRRCHVRDSPPRSSTSSPKSSAERPDFRSLLQRLEAIGEVRSVADGLYVPVASLDDAARRITDELGGARPDWGHRISVTCLELRANTSSRSSTTSTVRAMTVRDMRTEGRFPGRESSRSAPRGRDAWGNVSTACAVSDSGRYVTAARRSADFGRLTHRRTDRYYGVRRHACRCGITHGARLTLSYCTVVRRPR